MRFSGQLVALAGHSSGAGTIIKNDIEVRRQILRVVNGRKMELFYVLSPALFPSSFNRSRSCDFRLQSNLRMRYRQRVELMSQFPAKPNILK